MPPLSIMIKPASSLCNLRCKYCFYCDVAESRDVPNFGVMNEATAENLIKSALDFADGSSIAFAFQGGEPLIAGLEYFRFFVRIVKENNKKNSQIFFSVQTNGTLISDEWCDFFRENEFLVGLSLDGDREGNRFRVDEKGNNVYFKILKAAEKLKRHEVEFNILIVLTAFCAERCEKVYKYFRDGGFKYLQFIPCLRPFENDGAESELYMTDRQYASFLIKTFNLYVKDFVRGNYVSIRYFDNLVRMYLGERPEQCGLCGVCGRQLVVEGNGNLYPCDFFCTDEWLLGNINEISVRSALTGSKAERFVGESFQTEEKCKKCRFFLLCRAQGCKRQRIHADYCKAYEAFFSSCFPLFRVFKR